jgi:hypothetical protein
MSTSKTSKTSKNVTKVATSDRVTTALGHIKAAVAAMAPPQPAAAPRRRARRVTREPSPVPWDSPSVPAGAEGLFYFGASSVVASWGGAPSTYVR